MSDVSVGGSKLAVGSRDLTLTARESGSTDAMFEAAILEVNDVRPIRCLSTDARTVWIPRRYPSASTRASSSRIDGRKASSAAL
ncbi:hypothetical protein HB770_04190 [Rhizobium leguminosarum bv. viciae]|uniref:Uncharacterized protein n=1 Tax=Rhizobium leguminosarum bv. viciae TaxID=387 RepID=A0A7G6RHW3_RHILV|nr:hypothetical protein HB770_04190 [Rhizobium leguminosarum bv. viciae]